MNDTPEYIRQKQYEIYMSKPFKVRIENVFDLTELSRTIIQNRIKEENPGISDSELKAELFKTFYRFDFDRETLEKITEHLRSH